MANYKGVNIDNEISPFIPYMPLVETYREMLQSLQGVWDTLNLLGQLSGTTAEMSGTREAFAHLTGELLSNLAERMLAKRQQEMAAKALVVIDILVRNLFERTADIGFLATDGVVRRVAERGGDEHALRLRFREYVEKYSVYDDVVLLNCQGEVLASLNDHAAEQALKESWFFEAQSGDQPYTEYYGPSQLFPDRAAALIYAYRVCSPQGRLLGVLALSFRFTNEMDQVFAKLGAGSEQVVLALLDRDHQVIASNDRWQLPLGAPIHAEPGKLQRVRFAGRNYLAMISRPHGYQGYQGPGWLGLALLPLDQAFADLTAEGTHFDPTLLQSVLVSKRAFPEALRAIPRKAEAIQRNLGRSVWNGTVRSSRAQAAINPEFSKILLREISRTGMRMREVFSTSIGQLQTTVLSSQLDDCAFIADLAIDIMDRNLYERANDCRWWAMDPVIAACLAQPDPQQKSEEIGRVLAYINGLYTVYARLVVFDAKGCILAVSRPEENAQWVGKTLETPWVNAGLALNNSQAYAVSDFVPTPLYDHRPTYIYTAAIRAPGSQQVTGGIGIVFDSHQQFRTMLRDVLPCDAEGKALPGCTTLFIDGEQRIIATSDDQWDIGETLPLPLDTLNLSNGKGCGLMQADGQVYAVGLSRSRGYREYKSKDDSYRNDVTAVMLVALGETGGDTRTAKSQQRRELAVAQRHQAVPGMEVATFLLGDYWLGLPVADVVEAIELDQVTRLANAPAQVFGALLYQGQSLPLYNLHGALGIAPAVETETMQVVVIKGESNTLYGILVDALLEVVEVPLDDIADVSSVYVGITPVLASVVRTHEPGQAMLTLLSTASMARSLAR